MLDCEELKTAHYKAEHKHVLEGLQLHSSFCFTSLVIYILMSNTTILALCQHTDLFE